MTNCHALDDVITTYVDGEASSAMSAFVVEHLRTCAACRAEVEAESTARHVLRTHAAAARTTGVAPVWRPQVFRLGQPLISKATSGIASAVIAVAVLAGALLLRPKTVEAVGVIGDSICGARRHTHIASEIDGRNCTVNCVMHGAEFILVSGSTVYRIENQQFPDLQAFANTRVTVTGTITKNAITLRRVVSVANTKDF